MKIKIICSIVACLQLYHGLLAGAEEPESAPNSTAFPAMAAINSGLPYFFTMDQNIGTLVVGKTYLFRRDMASKKDIVSSVSDYRSISAYSMSEAVNKLNFWGVPVTLSSNDGSGICLVQEGFSGCTAHLKASLFGSPASQAPNARELVYNQYLDNYVSQTVQAGNGNLINAGPSNAFYELGNNFKYLSRLLPFVTKPNLYNGLADNLNSAYNSLKSSLVPAVANSGDSAYKTQIAGFAVGMPAYLELTKDASIPAFTKQITDPYITWIYSQKYGLSNESIADYINNDTSLRSVPVLRAVFLDFALPRQLVGVDTLDANFMKKGMQNFFAFQTIGDSQVVCNDTHTPNSTLSPQAMNEGYGGFPHMAAGDTCTQDKDHTGGYIISLQSLWNYLRVNCGGHSSGDFWQHTCQNLPSNLLAALAWLDSLQLNDGTGRTWNAFPGTLRPDAPGNPDPPKMDAQCFETTSYNFWSLYVQMAPYFPDSTPVKVNYGGQTKLLSEMATAAQSTVDCIVDNNGSWIWAPEYIRAKAMRAGVNLPETAW